MPRDIEGMDGTQLDIVIRARRVAQRDQARLVAWQVTEIRNIAGAMGGSRLHWTVAQTMGEEPPPTEARANDVGAIMAHAEAVREDVAEREQQEGAAWVDSFDIGDAVLDDAPLVVEGEDS